MVKLISSLLIACLGVVGVGINETSGANNRSGWTLESNRKMNVLMDVGMPQSLAISLIKECKAQAKNPAHCVRIGASIMGAESTLGTNCTQSFNCFGMEDGATKYANTADGVRDWVRRYAKHWYKQKSPSGFYSEKSGVIPPTHYCMGKKRDGVCKEGYKNSWKVWNKLSSFR